jgi:hypothetical protein
VLDERQNNYPSRPASPPPPRPAPNEYPRQDTPGSPGFTRVPQGRPLGRAAEAPPQRQAERPLADFSMVTSAVEELGDEEKTEVARPVEDIAPPVRTQPARTTRSADARSAQTPAAGTRNSRTRPAPAPANPSRVWVQLATGSNRAGLTFTYGQFRQRAGALLSGRAPHAGPNRLLVGPFPNEAAAASFARQLSARGVPSHSWTSEAGQRIDQLAAATNDSRSTTRTASSERSDAGGRNARGGSSTRNQRSGDRNERTASNGGRNRNGTTTSRTGAGNGRTGNSRTGTASSSRNGRNSPANTRTASAGNGRNGSGSGRSTARNGKPPATASARTSRGGSSGQSRSSSRRGR